ncbi:PPOX class F420-dependent oxidoreductase [Catellatospora methionotrophica]|uniref:PPOX class F420-dependent oxidoreductase n=1 Tax=Catellatospora methionotrophica TaxID=121620 RepID=A0A8J3LD44_9ACTN|nr:PPOX class F420-dependent oxidoreductase [Catellatospora methionotrophica]GIG12861.1 PPOX class F420-dependent oxidoreductase [Catellatospora methionotrophica]
MPTVADLEFGKYLLVTTFRRDGRAVPTPVWAVRDGADIYVWTVADSGKVKRLRRSSKVTISDCDVRGRVTGPTIPARARLLGPDETASVRHLLAGKYGILGRITMWGSWLRRGANGTVGVRITEPVARA